MHSKFRGRQALVLTLAAALLGSGFVAGKILVAKIPPLSLVGWRFIGASLAVLILAIAFDRKNWRIPPFKITLLGLLQTTAVMALLYTGLKVLPASTSSVLLFSNPIWVALFSIILLREPLTKSTGAGLILGIAGVIAVLGGVQGASHLGDDALVLGASFAWSFATMLSTRLPRSVSSWWVSTMQMAVGGIALLILATLSHQHFPAHISNSDWAWFAWLTLAGTAGGFGLWLVGLRMGEATGASAYLFLVPLFAVVFSALILSERLSLLQLLGGVLIFGSLILIGITEKKPIIEEFMP